MSLTTTVIIALQVSKTVLAINKQHYFLEGRVSPSSISVYQYNYKRSGGFKREIQGFMDPPRLLLQAYLTMFHKLEGEARGARHALAVSIQ